MTPNTTAGSRYVSAAFTNRADAESAMNELRRIGVPDSAISVVAQQGNQTTATGDMADAGKGGNDAVKGMTIGAGVGALFGLAALAIPGVGPFITAGFLAEAFGVAGGATVAGAIVGGTSGGLAGALTDHGYDEASAKYYAGQVQNGATFVTVNTQAPVATGGAINAQGVRELFQRFNGSFAS